MGRGVVSERMKDFTSSAFGFIRAKKDTYETGSRFLKMRVWIVAFVLADVVATLGFVFFSGGRPLDVVVWFEPGFPANMLVLRNETGAVLEDATLVLDGKYTLEVERIERGLNGFEVNHAFRDAQEFAPSDKYRPVSLEIRVDGDAVSLQIGAQGGAPR